LEIYSLAWSFRINKIYSHDTYSAVFFLYAGRIKQAEKSSNLLCEYLCLPLLRKEALYACILLAEDDWVIMFKRKHLLVLLTYTVLHVGAKYYYIVYVLE
jgi:hypothetical protein